MPLTVLDHSFGGKEIGACFRKTREGPERDLIEWFLETTPFHVPRGCRATLFREPQVESGFPDLVLVVWNEVVAQRWNPLRVCLTKADLRLLHHLCQTGPATCRELKALLGTVPRKSLTRLESAALVRVTGDRCIPRPLSTLFAVRDIVAIEAKVGKWEEVLDQAFVNTWFSSASYALVPRLPKQKKLIDTAARRGIGIWAKEGMHKSECRLLRRIPSSYASWLFNEWVWRAASLLANLQLGYSA